jgi:hypothetical protein
LMQMVAVQGANGAEGRRRKERPMGPWKRKVVGA